MERDLMRMQSVLGRGPVAARSLPSAERRWLERAAVRGQAHRLLPGVYCAADDKDLFGVRVMAAGLADPTFVVTHEAAARLLWWRELDVPTVRGATTGRCRSYVGYAFDRRPRPPAELLVSCGRLMVSRPALSVLDLLPRCGARVIDEALRRRSTTIPELLHALSLTPGRRGNGMREVLLAESRDSPWSQLEREAHVILRRAGVGGWVANHRVDVAGRAFFLDIAFRSLRLACELDSWEFHGDRDSFVRDRQRDVALQLAGWQVLRFTWADLPDLAGRVAEAVAVAKRAVKPGHRV